MNFCGLSFDTKQHKSLHFSSRLSLSLACLAKYAVFFLSCCRLSSPGDISLSFPRARRTTVTLHGFSIYGVTEIDRHLPPSLSPASLLGCMSVPSPRSLSTALIFSGRLRGCGVQAVLICMYLKIYMYLSLLYEARSSYHVVWRIPCGPRVRTNAWLPALFAAGAPAIRIYNRRVRLWEFPVSL